MVTGPTARAATITAAAAAAAIAGAAASARPARADLAPPAMARLDLGPEARIRLAYLGAIAAPGDVHGASLLVAYTRPVAARLAASAEVGLQWAARGPQDGASLAGVTIGGIYVPAASGARTTAVRAEVTAPLASDRGEAAIAGEVHGGLRTADGERFAAGVTTLGVFGAARIDRAKAFAQVEVGAQARVVAGARDAGRLRVGVAGGVAVARRIALVAELTTVAAILGAGFEDGADDAAPRETFRHTLDLGARVALGRVAVGVRLQVPLDRALRDQDVFVVGVDAALWR